MKMKNGIIQPAAPVRPLILPPGFVFGASTSAYQIEGGAGPETGRGPSHWEKYFAHRPHLENGDVACDHYNRMPEDVALMKRMGLDAYRFSLSWPRILPKGTGRRNEQGLEFYDRLVDRLLEAGIEPYATLYHWDLPAALHEDGHGWLNRDTAFHFADYAALASRRLGDRVKNWATLNEPEVIVAGYLGDGLAPGFRLPNKRVNVVHNLMLAHGLGVQALRGAGSDLNVGIVTNLVPVEPATPAAADVARLRWQRNYGLYLDAILKAQYPDNVLFEAECNRFKIPAGDMAIISQPIDMLGVNWYLRQVVDEKDNVLDVPGADKTLMGWEICPSALSRMLVSMKAEYGSLLPPIFITENGAAIRDAVTKGKIHDPVRTKYIYDHLCELETAVASGVDVRGYMAWSLFDNLEWSLGHAMTFGLVHVDRTTMKRTIKDSGLWYSKMIAAHRQTR